MRPFAAALAALLFAAVPAAAQDKGQPGRFDYFVLSLSWSPSFCAQAGEKAEPTQCAPGSRFGFVVHGLWPQYKQGHPEYCASTGGLPASLVDAMQPLMPSKRLVMHQWRKHGTCFGGPPEAYFAATRAAAERVHVPAALLAPAEPLRLKLAEIEEMFAAVNPGLDGGVLALVCRGRQLEEIQVCFDKGLSFRRCSLDVQDRCSKNEPILIPPVQ